jgi:hypothetical protein
VTVSRSDLDRLRARFKGHQTQLVTNRRNVEVEGKLERLLELHVEWIDSSKPRQLGAARQAIHHGGCELVLVATGFVGHDVDSMLKSACKLAKSPFISVRKGSISACLRALKAFEQCERR